MGLLCVEKYRWYLFVFLLKSDMLLILLHA